jgi:hypothetical protein
LIGSRPSDSTSASDCSILSATTARPTGQ